MLLKGEVKHLPFKYYIEVEINYDINKYNFSFISRNVYPVFDYTIKNFIMYSVLKVSITEISG